MAPTSYRCHHDVLPRKATMTPPLPLQRSSSQRRITFISIAVALTLVVILGGVKAVQVMGHIAEGKKKGPPPTTVSTLVAKPENWEPALTLVTSLTAAEGALLSTETAGVVAKVIGDEDRGSDQARPITIDAGTLLLELDTTVERAELAAAEARTWEAKKALDRAAFLAPRQASSRSELDQAEATFRARSAEAHAIEARIARKQIRAPFRGQLGIRQVNVGSYVSPGTPIIPLYQLDTMHADFAVPQDQFSQISIGQPVNISVAGAGPSLTGSSSTKAQGTITAIDPQVDPASRLLSVRATVANPDFRLRPGMFGTATIPLGKPVSVIPVPEPAIAFAPYGNSVFVIRAAPSSSTSGPQSAEIEQRFVTLGERRGDLIAILSGLQPGERFVSAGTFRLRSGMTVLIDDTLQPSGETNPQPPKT